MSIFELEQDRIVQLPETSFSAEGVKERQDLQRILRSRIEVLDPDLLIIAEEYGDWEESRRRIDLLVLDRDAKLVVIELKRTDDGGHMELQALRYAAMVSTMTFTQAVEAYRGVLTREGKDADPEQGILDFLAWDDVDEERFASDVRLLLVAQDFSRELTTAVMWLSERDLDIRCIRIRPYRLGDRLLLDVQQIIPLPEAATTKYGFERRSSHSVIESRVNGPATSTSMSTKETGEAGRISADTVSCRPAAGLAGSAHSGSCSQETRSTRIRKAGDTLG